MTPKKFLTSALTLSILIKLVVGACDRSCGSNQVDYPFGVNEGCGHPDYRLICTNESLQLRVNNSFVPIRSMDYKQSSLTLGDSPLLKSSSQCPLPEISSAGFQIFVCNSRDQVLCNSSNDTSCCITRSGDLAQCSKYDTGLSFSTASSRGLIPWSTDLSLRWSLPLQSNCTSCKNSKGNCGYNATSDFICICGTTNTTSQCKACGSGGPCSSTKKPVILSGSVAVAVIVVVLFFGVGISIYWKWKKNGSEDEQQPVFTVDDGNDSKDHMQNFRNMLSVRRGDSARVFSLADLEKATNGFAKENKLGAGGFGTVYKGVFDDGVVMAVKKSNHTSKHSNQHFFNEVNILSQVNHRHLVRLVGCCIDNTDVPLLVYDYVSNGTLFDHLHKKTDKITIEAVLTWHRRLRIAIETAEALAYLHSAAFPPIYHRDVKSSNILLDENFTARVIDFGLSRLVPVDVTHVSTMVVGTPGYVDPEYYQTYQLTDKSDVYSFGVVLLELVTGKRPVDFSRSSRDVNLSTFSTSFIKKGLLEEIIDPRLLHEGEEVINSIKAVASLALECLAFFREDRPSMKQVLEELLRIRGSSRVGPTQDRENWFEGEQILSTNPTSADPLSYSSVTSSSVRDDNSTELAPR